jgi:putative transcriptional regulator
MRFTTSIKMRAKIFALAMLAALLLPSISAADDSKPYFLVATPELPDPVFEESVILMLPHSEVPSESGEGVLVVGLIINKPSTVPVSELFPKTGDLKGAAVSAFFGGPVEPREPSIVTRTAVGSDKSSSKLLDDLYLVTDPDAVADLLKRASASGPDLRLIMGRAQWSDTQLHAEIAEGSWYTIPANVGDVFSSDPKQIWKQLEQHGQLLEVDAPEPDSVFTLLKCAWPIETQVPRGGSPAAR